MRSRPLNIIVAAALLGVVTPVVAAQAATTPPTPPKVATPNVTIVGSAGTTGYRIELVKATLRVRSGTLKDLGASTWTGGPIARPQGGTFAPNITRWAPLVLGVLVEQGLDTKYLPGVLAQIEQESSGRPDVYNNWDINAKNGVASGGLLQIIYPTYVRYAKPGFQGTPTLISIPGATVKQTVAAPYQTVPYTNIWASLNYVTKVYGVQKFAAWNTGSNGAY